MKFKQFIPVVVLFLIGMIFNIFGALLKILHWEIGTVNGGLLIAIGSIAEVLSVVMLIFILLRFYFRKEK